jgi:phage replication initiation protein
MNATKIDWFEGRAQGGPGSVVEALRRSLGVHGHLLGSEKLSGGSLGYKHGESLTLGGMSAGRLSWGGESQRGWVTLALSGKGCEWIDDWAEAERHFGVLERWSLRRVDIALDTFKGESSFEAVCAAHAAGGFDGALGGRRPVLKTIVSSDDSGRTAYVGKRGNARFLRAYEKGLKDGQGQELLNGLPMRDWFRNELELRAVDGPFPLDLVANRDRYFAGAHPYLGELLAGVDGARFQITREASALLDLDAALANLQHQYGSTLFTAFACMRGDGAALLERIMGQRHNPALVRAGALLGAGVVA